MGCEKCAEAASKGLAFCPSCGNDLSGFKQEKVVEQEVQRPVTTGNKKENKKSKRWFMLLIALVVLGGAYYGLSSQVFTAEATTNKIRDAIRSSDSTELAQHVEFDGKLIDEDMAQRFLDALKETPEQKDKLMDYLLLAGASIQAENKSDVPGQVLASGRQYGIFKNYRLRLDGVQTEVISNFKGTKVTLVNPVGSESSKASADGIMMDGVYPGLTDAKIAYDGEYGKESGDVTINPLTLDASDRKYVIKLKGNAVALDQTYPDALVVVAGKSTSKTVSELESYGPIPKNGITLSIKNQFAWGEETSEEVLVKPDTKKVIFAFTPSEALLNQVEGAVERHASEWVDAAEAQDTDYFTLVDDLSYLAQQERNYDGWSSRDKDWRGEFLNASIDRTTAKFVDYGGEVGIEVLATTYIRGELIDYYDDESSGASTSKSVFRYLFTYGSAPDSDESSEYFRIQKATNIK